MRFLLRHSPAQQMAVGQCETQNMLLPPPKLSASVAKLALGSAGG